MSYDKLVDSSILDAGMLATANAIREKTGGTEQIPWEEDNGFSSAIAAIESGDSRKDATLTYKLSGSGTSFSLYHVSESNEIVAAKSPDTVARTIRCKVGEVLIVSTSKSFTGSGSAPAISGSGYVSRLVAAASYSVGSTVYYRYAWMVVINSETASITMKA